MTDPIRLAAWTPPIAEAATWHLPFDAGLFAEAGLDVRWLARDGSPAALAALADGEADVAFVSGYGFLSAVARGAPVVAVYNLYPRSCFAIFGPAGRGIARPRDLAGRRVGLRSAHSSGVAWLTLALRLDGLRGDEVATAVVGGEPDGGVGALVGGRIDALVGSDAVLYDAVRAGLRERFVVWLDDLLPLPSDVLAVRRDRLDALASPLRRFLAAYERGLALAARRPGLAAEAIGRRAVDGDDGRRNRAMLALRLPLAAPRPGRRRGAFDAAELDHAAAVLAAHGLLPDAVRASAATIDALLP